MPCAKLTRRCATPARNFTTPRRNNLGYSESGAAAIRRGSPPRSFWQNGIASTLFSSPGEQKRNHSQRRKHRGSDEPAPKDELARVEIALRVSSHSDQKKEQRGVDQD